MNEPPSSGGQSGGSATSGATDGKRDGQSSNGSFGRRTWLSDARLGRRNVLKMLGIGAFVAGETAHVADGRRASRGRARSADVGASRVGTAVAAAGDLAVVGTRATGGAIPDDRAVYVVELSTGDPTPVARLPPPPGADEFGAAVGIDGDTAVVGAPLAESPTGNFDGTATVYSRTGATWTRRASLSSGDPTGVDRFGTAVAIDGDTLLVGASTDTNAAGFRVGSVAAFTRRGDDWTHSTTIVPEADVDRFGTSIALDGDTAVVGGRLADDSTARDAGIAEVFVRRGGSWMRSARLSPDGRARDDQFGSAVTLDGDTAVVGAPAESNDVGQRAGAAYVFTRSLGRWRPSGRLTDPGGGHDTRFGTSVAAAGGVAVVGGESGEPLAFSDAKRGGTPTSVVRRSRGRRRSTSAVAIDDGTALVTGVPGDPTRSSNERLLEAYEL